MIKEIASKNPKIINSMDSARVSRGCERYAEIAVDEEAVYGSRFDDSCESLTVE